MPARTTDELLDLDIPDIPPLVGGTDAKIVPADGIVTLAAPEKLGKSQVAMNLALCRALGRPWLQGIWSGYATTPGRTMYINAEISEGELKQRVRDMVALSGRPVVNQVIWVTVRGEGGWQVNQWDGVGRLKDLMAKYSPDLLILDPFTDLFWGDENDQARVKDFMRIIKGLKLPVIIVHHFRKAPRDPRHRRQGPQEMSGSRVLTGSPDSLLWMEPEGEIEEGKAWLKFRLRNSPSPPALYIERGAHQWWGSATYVPKKQGRPSGGLEEDIQGCLNRVPGATRSEVARMLGKSPKDGNLRRLWDKVPKYPPP